MPIDDRLSASEQRPNPLSVRTVSELARQLRLLRLRVPRPQPTDDPLTLRALAAMTALPVSTLCNAESGRILPRTEVVYRIAQACGAPPEDLPLWTQARQRAAENRARPARPTNPVKVRDGQVVAATEKASIIEELPSLTAASYLDTLAPHVAAECLTTIDRRAAAERLSVMSLSHAAECLALMAPIIAAELLQTEKPTMAVEHLQAMPARACRHVLAAMATHDAAQWLSFLSRNIAYSLAAEMPLAWKATLLITTTLPTALATELLFTGRYEWAVSVLCDMPTNRAANLLATMAADPASGLLTGLPQQRAAELIAAMPASRAAFILTETEDDTLEQILVEMPAQLAATVLANLPARRAARYLARCKPRRMNQLLSLTLPPRAATMRQLLVPAPQSLPFVAAPPRTATRRTKPTSARRQAAASGSSPSRDS
ncbi:magnesium transporter MgtE N-terminal domain-containing protein [Actinoplanes sp. DH11]|uniref:magnesium transporter MgtE N-terminal domain-containing protein n=1 Tax=Actinoplanes sp. DH11 TaxID=2857011 RepID=UPI001E507C90|nr:helix-turn-helix domain-containing protein [Actinoplanes sp. DH11]